MRLNRDDLVRLCPRPKKAGEAQTNWDGYVDALTSGEGAALFRDYGVHSSANLCGFLANAAQETGDKGGFTCLWENMNFRSVAAIRGAWHARASKVSDAWIKENLIGRPEALAEWAYAGRMGNGTGNGDAYLYRGFGILQVTGKTDHIRYLKGEHTYIAALRAALAEWHDKGCGAYVDSGDFDTACILINGGRNGLAERKAFYAKARQIWTEDPIWDEPVSVASVPSPLPIPSQPMTAPDLVGVSRKVTLLDRVRKMLAALGIGGTGLSFADFENQGDTIHAVLQFLKENAYLALLGGCLVGVALATVLIQWHVEDHNEGRYIPRGSK